MSDGAWLPHHKAVAIEGSRRLEAKDQRHSSGRRGVNRCQLATGCRRGQQLQIVGHKRKSEVLARQAAGLHARAGTSTSNVTSNAR